jgi:site-specific DNA recombinase
MKQIAAVYARVSTLQQEQEATIESQVAAIEQYAQGYQLLPEYYFLDQAVSGAQLARPALDRLRDLAAEGIFALLLCWDPDRLARQYVHQCVLLDELQRAGVTVRFVNQPLIADNAQGQLLLGIQGLFAEYERALIIERLRRGKLHRMRQGQLVNPVPPYGYTYLPVSQPGGGRWEIYAREASIVRQIYEWYTQERLTLSVIVERLAQLGEQAPARGKRWTYSTVQAILKQPAYTGQAYYNRTRTCPEAIGQPKRSGRGLRRTPKHEPRPPEDWIAVQVPAILPEERWQQAQERLKMQQKFATRNARRFYLLRSLLVCDICGRTLVGRTTKGYVGYYCTSRGKNRYPDVPIHSRCISAQIIEPLVWQAVVELLRNPTLLADAWESQVTADLIPADETDRLQARLKALERQWLRLLDLFQEEQLEKEELLQRKARLDHERGRIAGRLQHLTRQARHEQAKQQMLVDFATFCQQVEAGVSNPTPELQQEVIRLLIDHVVVGENEIVIKHIVPTDDDCRLLPGRR